MLAIRSNGKRLVYAVEEKGGFEPDEISKNKLSIFTFNYDRSLDYFLYQSVLSNFGEAVASKNPAANIEITHMYGRLGKLPWQTGSDAVRPWGQMAPNDVVTAAKGLRLIFEAEQDENLKSRIAKMLKESRDI